MQLQWLKVCTSSVSGTVFVGVCLRHCPCLQVPHSYEAAATRSSAVERQHMTHSTPAAVAPDSAPAAAAAHFKAGQHDASKPFAASLASISLAPRFQQVDTAGVANMTATVMDPSWQPVAGVEVSFMYWWINTEDSLMGPQLATFGDSTYGLDLGDATASQNSAAADTAVAVKSAITDDQGKAHLSFNSSTPGQVSVIASVQGSMTMSQPAMVAWLDGIYTLKAAKTVQHRAQPLDQGRRQAKHLPWLSKSKKGR